MADEYVLARFEPMYFSGVKRPSHIVLNSPARYGGYLHPALCGVHPTRAVQAKLATAECHKCLRKALAAGIIEPPAELGDPVHGGDVFSRIEASEGR